MGRETQLQQNRQISGTKYIKLETGPRGPCGAEGLSRISILDFVTSRFPCLSATLGPWGGVTDSEYDIVELKFHSSYVSHDGV